MNDSPFNALRHYFLGGVLLSISLSAFSAEWLVEPNVKARLEYNDNIFLTSLPHDSVSALKITPSLDAIVREANWQADLNARITNNNYSDNTLDTTDQFYDLTGTFNGERHRFSLSGSYILDSNLSSVSSDFGVFGQRVNREIKQVSPRYTYLLNERSTLVFSYSYNETDYIDSAGSRFVPYTLQTLSGSYVYDLTENDRLTFSLQGTDYKRKDNRTQYTLLTSRFGLEHDFSETLSFDFLAGTSRQRTTNRFDQVVNFFGRPIIISQETESSNRGLVLDAGLKQKFETSHVEGRVSRSDVTDSLGNLNQVDKLTLAYHHKLSELWRYDTHARYENIVAQSSSVGGNTVDRKLLFFDTTVTYKLTQKWTANFTYRYISRRFNSDTSNDRAPHSNLVYAGISYNFPSFTTF